MLSSGVEFSIEPLRFFVRARCVDERFLGPFGEVDADHPFPVLFHFRAPCFRIGAGRLRFSGVLQSSNRGRAASAAHHTKFVDGQSDTIFLSGSPSVPQNVSDCHRLPDPVGSRIHRLTFDWKHNIF